jgi:hypothetical protein
MLGWTFAVGLYCKWLATMELKLQKTSLLLHVIDT